MKGFSELLRYLRGVTPLQVVACRTGLDARFLAEVEAGTVVVFDDVAEIILESGLSLHPRTARRLTRELRFTTLGLSKPFINQILRETDQARTKA